MNETVKTANEIIEQRTAEVIATEINTIKEQTQNIMLKASIEIGKRLTEAKGQLEHGEWGTWLVENVNYSTRTAQNLMKIHEEYGDLNTQSVAQLNYSKAVALLGIEAGEREQFLEENNVEEMSKRELEKAIKEKKELEQKLQEKEQESDEKQEEMQESIKELEEQLEAMEKESASHTSAEEREKLEREMHDLQSQLDEEKERAEKLEGELKESSTIPDEIKKELEELRNKTKDTRDEADIKFTVEFNTLVESFNNTLGATENVTNNENKKKYKKAIKKLMDKMSDLLEGDNTPEAPEGQTSIEDFSKV